MSLSSFFGLPTAAPSAPDPLVPFLSELRDRLRAQLATDGPGKTAILSISASQDAFLTDSIAKQNNQFCSTWGSDAELQDQAVIDAFVELVSAARELDPRLQKLFDQMVPKKATERQFWWRYFGTVHSYLMRLAPTPDEMLADLMAKLPPPRPLEERRFAPAESPLSSDGDLSREQVLKFMSATSDMLSSPQTLGNLADDIATRMASASDDQPANAKVIASTLSVSYQMELLEHMGIERAHGIRQMHPPHLMARFKKDGQTDAELEAALQQMVSVCQQAPAAAVARMHQRPDSDHSKRRFQPAPECRPSDSLEIEQLADIVNGLRIMVEDPTTVDMAQAAVKTAVQDKDATRNPEVVKDTCMNEVLRWQREYLEHRGVQHEGGMDLVWSIPEKYPPKPGPTNDLLQAFGKLRLAMQSTVANACIEATKPPEVQRHLRRYEPAAELQMKGQIPRDKILKFTRTVSSELMSKESINLLSKAGGQQQACELSVQWQRQILEQHGIQMDFGCRALTEVPQRFGTDKEVMKAFKEFQKACAQSLQRAMEAHAIEISKPPDIAPDQRRYPPASHLQDDGELSRSKILKFTRRCAEELENDESIEQLVQVARAIPDGPTSKAAQQAMGALSVQWQRQILEHLGIEMEFGCRSLSSVPARFGSDREVMMAFQKFTQSCMQAIKLAIEKSAM